MNITYECLQCKTPSRIEWTPEQGPLRCSHCSVEFEPSQRCERDGKLSQCAICGTEDMYRQKDFPHRLGLAIVGIGILLSSIAWYHYHYPLAIGVFLLTGLLDLLLYYLIGDVVICYRCLAQYRAAPHNPSHEPYDLAVGERYRQERIRLDQMKRGKQT